EMEAFFRLCPCRIIAVTGSDGKTTTTTVISELLKAAGYTVFLGGNIGTPLLDKLPEMRPEDMAVLELSSFQLHSMECRPHVAVITNVSPNHLDVHPNYEDYQTAKKQIFLGQRAEDILVLNADNTITRAMAQEAKSEVRFFSRQDKPANGCYFDGASVWRAENGRETKIVDVSDILLPGLHNVENYMAAFAATGGMVSDETCRKVAGSFRGVAHRLEMIRTLHGVTYCNDSIASSPTRTIAGLRALKQKPILIAGGYDKHIPFDELGGEICRRVKELFLTGFTAEKIAAAVTDSPDYDSEKLKIHIIGDFRETVLAASAAAEEGDLVLLSPACASFDKFRNFEERGNTFRRIVTELE
ncbi:MAG: UDP-N-acetylmuramoyl-L-alanine--D-glutamate ligase, partial [Oscillospiraceae bacterium]|nr:UDP-N-acetylmuramoyl-L-alanine--D-glutamate ligase [Oscillospiraceae bacterium]